MKKYTEAELIKMANGKMELPKGISRTKYGYRIYRRIDNKKYNFGSFQNINLVIKTNEYIERLAKDFRAELERKVNAEESLRKVLDEKNQVEKVWNTQRFAEMTQLINKQSSQIDQLKNIVHAMAVEVAKASNKKSFVGKLFSR